MWFLWAVHYWRLANEAAQRNNPVTANKGPESRDADCPARGPGLSHTPSPVNQLRCRHCMQPLLLPSVPAVPEHPDTNTESNMEMPPLDVVARLRALGMMPVNDPLEEPKMITGLGPQGTEYAPGRTRGGILSEKDKRRLTFYVHFLRTRTQDDRYDPDRVDTPNGADTGSV